MISRERTQKRKQTETLLPVKLSSVFAYALKSAKMNRNKKGRFSKVIRHSCKKGRPPVDHTYYTLKEKQAEMDTESQCKGSETWKIGRRIVEWGVLLENLRCCKKCGLGPVPLTYDSVKGELQKALGGYLYVECSFHDCRHINIAAYGKTHRDPTKKKGMPSFVVNTKLGTSKSYIYVIYIYVLHCSVAFYVCMSFLAGGKMKILSLFRTLAVYVLRNLIKYTGT